MMCMDHTGLDVAVQWLVRRGGSYTYSFTTSRPSPKGVRCFDQHGIFPLPIVSLLWANGGPNHGQHAQRVLWRGRVQKGESVPFLSTFRSRSNKYSPPLSSPIMFSLSSIVRAKRSSSICSATYHCMKLCVV